MGLETETHRFMGDGSQWVIGGVAMAATTSILNDQPSKVKGVPMGTFKKFVVGEMILRYVSGIALQTLRHKKPEWFRTETDRKIVHLSLEIEAINRDIVSLINYHDRSNELFEDRIRSTRDYWNKELTEVKKSVTNRNYAAKSINDIVANQRSLRDEQVKITKWQSQIVERLEMLEGKMK